MKEKEYKFKFNLANANIVSILIFVALLVITFFIFSKLHNEYVLVFSYKPFLMTTMILYFILHEILHGVGYVLGGAKPKNIYFGIALEKGILYCLCREEVKKKSILTSLQMPFTVIGIITYVISIITHDSLLLFLSIANLTGASMDLIMFFYIMRIKNVRYSETDKNDEFVLITKDDLTKKKSKLFKIIEIKDYDKNDFKFPKKKRIEISKFSIVILLLLFIIDLAAALLTWI